MTDEEMEAFFDAHAARAVAARVRALLAEGRLARQGAADFAQELAARVWARIGKYDPARSTPAGFCCMLADRQARAILASGQAAKRDPAREVAFTDTAHPADEAEHREMALDLEIAIASLRPRQRRLAELLRSKSVTAAAEALGIHRSTAHQEIAAIRLRFEAVGLAGYLE